MTITREQVADLQPGDVVEVQFAGGSIMRGPLTAHGYGGEPLLGIADVHWPLRLRDGEVQHYLKSCTLTVVSRAPRPLYVNHPRTEPMAGDVARDADGPDSDTWHYLGCAGWFDAFGVSWHRSDLSARLRLLVDGATGQVVQ